MNRSLADEIPGDAVEVVSENQARLAPILHYIAERLADDLSGEHLAAIAGMSVRHLNRLFVGVTGEPLHQYIKRRRLERAASLLILSDWSVKEIASECGYSSHEAFTRAFIESFGISPIQHRQTPSLRHSPLVMDGIPLSDTPDARLVERPATRIAYVRHEGPYEQAYRAWVPLFLWAWRAHRLQAGTVLLGISFDDERLAPEATLRYDAAIEVESSFTGDDAILARDLPGGYFLCWHTEGTFEDYFRRSDYFFNTWFPTSGFSLNPEQMYGLDRYHLSESHLQHPWRLLFGIPRHFAVDIHIPIALRGRPLRQ